MDGFQKHPVYDSYAAHKDGRVMNIVSSKPIKACILDSNSTPFLVILRSARSPHARLKLSDDSAMVSSVALRLASWTAASDKVAR